MVTCWAFVSLSHALQHNKYRPIHIHFLLFEPFHFYLSCLDIFSLFLAFFVFYRLFSFFLYFSTFLFLSPIFHLSLPLHSHELCLWNVLVNDKLLIAVFIGNIMTFCSIRKQFHRNCSNSWHFHLTRTNLSTFLIQNMLWNLSILSNWNFYFSLHIHILFEFSFRSASVTEQTGIVLNRLYATKTYWFYARGHYMLMTLDV